MALRLNSLFVLLCLLLSTAGFAQDDPAVRESEREYKDGEQFEKFRKRRRIISAWQINRLKEGALVVKLKANNLVISALERSGESEAAEVKRIETAGVNINMMRAFRNHFNFCKVYFVYAHQADSLLKGVRKNIFLDSNLRVDPNLVMTEKFYMLAETDRLYNSSIGFVPEDSARYVAEKGSPTTEEPYIVMKNKYGHQLKKPFPYFSKIKAGLEQVPEVTFIDIDGEQIPFNVVVLMKRRYGVAFNHQGKRIEVFIPKSFIYERLSLMVLSLNDELHAYYQAHPDPRVNAEVKPFLY